MDALGKVLIDLAGKSPNQRKLTDTEETVVFEVVRCLRVLLNTPVRFYEFLVISTDETLF